MLKIITPTWDFERPVVELAPIHSRGADKGWLRKSAACFTQEIADLTPKKGHSYLHVISLGCGEKYGPNLNQDWFGRDVLRSYHNTFKKYAKVYKHHSNSNPEKASGYIVAETYNEPMGRGELLIGVDNDKWGEELQKVASGDDIFLSMSCHVSHDICSICGNKASNRSQYCDHLKKSGNVILDDGRQVYAINPDPKFFDISRVIRPADRIAYTLRKVASQEHIKGGAELAEESGLVEPLDLMLASESRCVAEKFATAQKLSEIEKQIDGQADNVVIPMTMGNYPDASEMSDLFRMGPGLFQAAPALSNENIGLKQAADASRLSDIWGALANAEVSLPARDFFKIVVGDKFSDVEQFLPEVETALPSMFSDLESNPGKLRDLCADDTYDAQASGSLPLGLSDITRKFSLAPGPLRKRMVITIIRGNDKPKIKTAASRELSDGARPLLEEYAKYKISLASALPDAAKQLLVLQNFVEKN